VKNILESLRSLVSPKDATNSMIDSQTFAFVRTRKAILRELVASWKSRNIVGVYCGAFGEGMFLVAVEDIEPTDKSEVIAFHQYDISGKILNRTRVELDEIQMLCPFNEVYQNPLFKEKFEKKQAINIPI
jgi:hypothetical protein